jgi:hypothetical protein
MFRIDIKKLFIIVGVIFYCIATYAKQPKYSEKINGGKLITETSPNGTSTITYVGYQITNREVDKKGNVKVECRGSGNNSCPRGVASIASDIYDWVIESVHFSIDMGETAGEFLIGDLVCTWSDGEKDADENDADIFIYSYNLEITDATPAIPMTITVFPNPIQTGNLSVRFSNPINDVITIRIIDDMGNTHLLVDKYVTGDVLVLTDAETYSLASDMYHIICTTADNDMAHASFVKR